MSKESIKKVALDIDVSDESYRFKPSIEYALSQAETELSDISESID